ncbi:MAG TPA: hypothetical protein VIH57_00340 [Bacteroidales bacterium]
MVKLRNINTTAIVIVCILMDTLVLLLELPKHSISLISVLKIILVVDVFMGFLLNFGCWNVYIFETGIGFKNNLMFYWKNKYKFKYEEISSIEITQGKNGPFIHVNANGKTKRFYSIGYKKTKEFTDLMIKKGIKIIDENEYEAPIMRAWSSRKNKK